MCFPRTERLTDKPRCLAVLRGVIRPIFLNQAGIGLTQKG